MTASKSAPFRISRVFDAPRDLVWKAFSDCKHLVHWWGPKGFKVKHCKLDFRPGGIFHYGMQGPDGSMMWGKFVYREIVAPERIVNTVSFSDEKLAVTRHPMAPVWPLETLAETIFTAEGNKTRISLSWTAHNPSAEEQAMFDAGHASMTQGWTGTMDQLESYLVKAKAA